MEIQHEQSFAKMSIRRCNFMKGERPFHWHEKVEIVICLNKGLGLLIDGVRYELEAGDIAVIGGQIVHKFDVYDDDTGFVILQFSYDILLKSGIILFPVQPVIRKDEIEAISGLRENMDKLLDVMMWDTAGCEENDIFLQHMFSGLYCLLMRYFKTQDTERYGRQKEKNEFYRIVVYVNEHYREDITVQSIAGELYMDRGRLSKLFRKYSGIALNDYINSLRLLQAQKLIGEGMTVTGAALESGFQSVRTYNNVKKSINNQF